MKRVLITGANGQDGAYLAQLLLALGCEVYAGIRRTSSPPLWRLEALGIAGDVRLIPLDLLDEGHVLRTVAAVAPDEVYTLAAQSFVAVSFEQPLSTAGVTAMGALRILDAVRTLRGQARVYQASTSEMFGDAKQSPQTEDTTFAPASPYAVAKLFAHWQAVTYRRAFGVHACCGIAFNHESPLRGVEFVTQKVVQGLVRIRRGLQDAISLGNLDTRRDWGFAGDYVRAMQLAVQHPVPDDYVQTSTHLGAEASNGRVQIVHGFWRVA